MNLNFLQISRNPLISNTFKLILSSLTLHFLSLTSGKVLVGFLDHTASEIVLVQRNRLVQIKLWVKTGAT